MTDHISLTYFKNLRAGPSKLAWASIQLSQFKFRVCHLAGKNNSAADAICRTENLPTDALTAEAEARYEDNDIMDLQLTSEHTDMTITRDVGTQCDFHACTRKTTACNSLTVDDVTSCNNSSSGSNDGSSESSSSGSKHGDRRTATSATPKSAYTHKSKTHNWLA